MKILIFSQYYYPESFLLNEITVKLVEKGHKITVVTGLPNYPSGKIPKEYRHHRKRFEIINGVEVYRCSIISRGHNIFRLLLNYYTYQKNAYKVAKKIDQQFDFVWSYQNTPILQVVPAYKFAKRNNLKLLMYNCDLAPLCGDGTVIKSKLIYKIYANISKKIMSMPDVIAVSSKSFINYNHQINGVPVDKQHYLPQHASGYMLDINMESESNNIADFMFAGNIGKGAKLDVLVNATNILLKNNITNFHIHIVGDGSFLPKLKEIVEITGQKDFYTFYGRKTSEEMPQIYKLADALVITLRKGQITVPTKLQMYMTTGKPIFGSMDGSGNDIIHESGCGDCVEAENCDSFAGILENYISSKEKYDMCGDLGRKYFKENFMFETFVSKLQDIFLMME